MSFSGPSGVIRRSWSFFFFFFNDTATTEIYTLSLHDALPISGARPRHAGRRPRRHPPHRDGRGRPERCAERVCADPCRRGVEGRRAPVKVDAATRRSLGHAVARALRERIAAERLEPGDRLPSEPELARVLGVSRPSLREGIALLEEDGVVRRLRGSGTYVAHRSSVRNDLSRNFSVSSLIEAMALKPGSKSDECAAEPAPLRVATAL